MKHDFEARKKNRIAYAKELAAKKEKNAERLHSQAHDMAKVIPFGQPILVGHHSEKRDRNYRNKIENKYRKSFELQEQAAHYEEKAEAIESNTAIFSDDPEALDKLREKLSDLESLQQFMKDANKCIRKKDKVGFLKLKYGSEKLWLELATPDQFRTVGFPHYRLNNNNANINRLKKRIKQLEQVATRQTKAIEKNGIRLVENIEANRVQLIFPERVSKDTYKVLRHSGFIWCRSEGAFQRKLNPHAVYVAFDLLKTLSEKQPG